MSADRTPNPIVQLLADRWQVPLALAAAVTSAVTLYRLLPAPTSTDPQAVVADVRSLADSGQWEAAAAACAALLEQSPDLPQDTQAELHVRLAELIFAVESGRETHHPANLRKLLEHDQAAAGLGRPRTTAADLRAAHASLWLGDHEEAFRRFRALLDRDLPAAEQHVVVETLARLLERQPDLGVAGREVLTNLLADEGLSAGYAWWALNHAVRTALDERNVPLANDLLDRYGDRFKTSDLRGLLEYLRASVLVAEGKVEEAEPVIQWVDDWLAQYGRTLPEQCYHVVGLNRALAGQVHLAAGRPADALAAFEDALRGPLTNELRILAGVGRAQALAALDRHADARDAFRSTVAAIAREPALVNRVMPLFHKTLRAIADQRRAHGDFANEVAYLALGSELSATAAMGREPGEADRGSGRASVDEKDLLAWKNLELACGLLRYDDERLTDLLWQAAQVYEAAGRGAELSGALERFIRERSDHPRIPAAMLRLGELCEANGDAEAALEWYRRVSEGYPSLEEAARARVNRARVLTELGPEHWPQAERLLSDFLNDGQIEPDAEVYRVALSTLCSLLLDAERYGEAIGRLEDYVVLYPTGAEHVRGLFRLGEAYRRSAHALRERVPEGNSPAVQAESRARYRRAAEVFAAVLRALPAEMEDGEERELLTRLALQYRADCLLAQGEPDAVEAALGAYWMITTRYADQPAGLTAHVQIAGIHLRRGEVAQAAGALERARVLLRHMLDEALADLASGTRAEWERFLSLALSSEAFRDALVTAR